MKIKQIILSTGMLLLWAIGMQGLAFVYDMFDATLTSPVWDPHYNWAPFLISASLASLAVSIVRWHVLDRRFAFWQTWSTWPRHFRGKHGLRQRTYTTR